MNSKNKSFNSGDGFTLIELLISLSLFVVLLSVAIGGFLQAVRIQRVVTELMSVNDNMSLIIEQMAREIRTGNNFQFSQNNNDLEFANSNNQSISYRLDQGSLERGEGTVSGGVCNDGSSPVNGFCYVKLASDDISVTDFNVFGLQGNSPGPQRITIILSFTSNRGDVSSLVKPIQIQTTISPRNF